MCGRFTSTSSIEDLAGCFDVDEVRADPLPARWNVAPTDPVLAVATRPGPDRRSALGRFRWGLVPPWAPNPSVGARMINARAESVATKPAFRRALARRRCLIPADAFYEWQVLEPAPDRAAATGGRRDRAAKPAKQPWAIRLASGEPLAFAGLWESWRDPDDPDGDRLRTCAIVTTAANEALTPIHHRMPVVLGRHAWATWLDPDVDDVHLLEALLVPAPDGWFTATRVSDLVNDVRRDGPELLDPAPAADGGEAQLLDL
jgi:putative SOS response-associated peptidase YedK